MPNTATEKLGTQFEVDGLAELLHLMGEVAKQAPVTGRAIRKMIGGRGARTSIVTAQPGQVQPIPLAPGNLTVLVQIAGISVPGGGTTTGPRSPGNSRRNVYGPHQRQADLVNALLKSPAGSAEFRDIQIALQANQRRLRALTSAGSPMRLGVAGPLQRRRDLEMALHDPLVRADPARYADTRRAYEANERRINGGTAQGKVMNAIVSTRVNLGAISPLLGRTLAVLEEMGPEGMAIAGVTTAAIAAASAIVDLARASADAANSFTRLQIMAGSGTRDTSTLQGIAAAIGVSPEQMGSTAQSLQSNITGSPMGRAAGMQLGVYNLPGLYGKQDYGQQLITAINNLSKIEDPTRRLALARAAGIESVLPLTYMSQQQRSYMQPDANLRSSLMTPEFQQESADFQASLGRVQQAVQNFLVAVGPSVLPEITGLFNAVADGVNAVAQAWAQNKGMIQDAIGAWLTVVNPVLGINYLENMSKADSSAAMIDNTKATRDNTRALVGQPGMYGSTRRSWSDALPVGLNGPSIEQGNRDLSAF